MKTKTKVIAASLAAAPFVLYVLMAWVGFGLVSPLSTDDKLQVEPHAVCQHQGYDIAVTYTPWEPYSWRCAYFSPSAVGIPVPLGSHDMEIEWWCLNERSGRHAHYKGEGTFFKAFHWQCRVEEAP